MLWNYNNIYSFKEELDLICKENEVYKYIGICSFKLNKLEDAKEYLTKAVDIGVRDES